MDPCHSTRPRTPISLAVQRHKNGSDFGGVVRKLLFVRAVEDPDGDLPEDQGFRR